MSTPDSIPTHLPWATPMTEPVLTLCQSRLYPPVRDFEFGLRSSTTVLNNKAEIGNGENGSIQVLENVGRV